MDQRQLETLRARCAPPERELRALHADGQRSVSPQPPSNAITGQNPTACAEGWRPQRSLAALRYHTQLVKSLLDKLDLPFAQLQEMRLGCQRRRACPSINPGFDETPWGAASEPTPSSSSSARAAPHPRAASAPNAGRRRWRTSPWGAIYLEVRPCCPLWRWDRTPSQCRANEQQNFCNRQQQQQQQPRQQQQKSDAAGEGREVDASGGGDSTPSTRCSSDECRGGFGGSSLNTLHFGCLSSDEAALVAEAEAHVCAALRHLAKASAKQAATHSSDVAPHDERGSSEGQTGVKTAAVVGDGGESRAKLPLPPSFAPYLDRLCETVWAFYIRARLVECILQGDPLRSAAWAVRCLGIGEPWTLRRLQEFAVLALEVASEIVESRSGGAAPISDASSVRKDADGANAARCFCEACAVYLGVPIIPRFEERLRRCVQALSDRGVFSPSRSGVHDEEADQRLRTALSAVARCDSTGNATSQPFDSASLDLKAVRAADPLNRCLNEAMANSVLEHRSGVCCLDAKCVVIAGAEAAVRLHSGQPWPPERQLRFMEVISSVPEFGLENGPRRAIPANLEECLEPDDNLGDEDADGWRKEVGIMLEDVSLDMLMGIRNVDCSRAKLAQKRIAGLCCAGASVQRPP